MAWGRGGGGGHTKGDILGSEVIAGSVVLCEPDDTHDGIDELNHQDGCEESSPWLKDDHPLPTRAASGTAAQPLLLQEPLAKQQEWKAGVPPMAFCLTDPKAVPPPFCPIGHHLVPCIVPSGPQCLPEKVTGKVDEEEALPCFFRISESCAGTLESDMS